MMTITQLSTDLQTLFGKTAEEIGKAPHVIQRQRKFSASTLAQSLVLGWLQDPESPLDALTSSAAAVGVCVSSQALDKRFTPACAEFLKQLLLQACQLRIESGSTPEVFSRFSTVFVLD